MCRATSSARMMVRVSLHLAASMYNVMRDGMCTTAAPIRPCPLMSKPCEQTRSSGVNLGVHGTREGGVSSYDMS